MRGEGSTPQVKWLRFWRLNGPSVVERGADSGTVHAIFPWITDAYTQKRLDRCTVGYSSVANLPHTQRRSDTKMRNSRFCKTTAALGVAAFVSIAALTACGGSETESPSSTTPTPTSTPGVTPTEKGIAPTGGNSFSPPVKAPPAPTGIPGTNHTG